MKVIESYKADSHNKNPLTLKFYHAHAKKIVKLGTREEGPLVQLIENLSNITDEVEHFISLNSFKPNSEQLKDLETRLNDLQQKWMNLSINPLPPIFWSLKDQVLLWTTCLEKTITL
jgi:hypothetical protein